MLMWICHLKWMESGNVCSKGAATTSIQVYFGIRGEILRPVYIQLPQFWPGSLIHHKSLT